MKGLKNRCLKCGSMAKETYTPAGYMRWQCPDCLFKWGHRFDNGSLMYWKGSKMNWRTAPDGYLAVFGWEVQP